MEKFRIGIIGAGHIAEKMAWTLTQMPETQPYAVASRSLEKAQAFGQKYGFEKAYGSYEELLEDPMVELVYVATPHSHHHAHVRMCLEKGKAVLCEKAFMLNRAQAEDVINLAKEKNVFLAEAIWTRYEPARQILDEIIASGEIGTPTFLKASLSYPVEDKERVRKPELGGGALLDLGVYCINFALMNFGSEIVKIHSTCRKNAEGVDVQESFTFQYKNGRTAMLAASVLCADDRQGIISGEKGYVIADNINNPLRFDIYRRGAELVRSVQVPQQITGFEYQVRACIEAIRAGKIEPDAMPHSEILKVLEIMDTLRNEWGVVFPDEMNF
jgi:predicted dehydrogenase